TSTTHPATMLQHLFFFLHQRQQRKSTLFPYTTLFRSGRATDLEDACACSAKIRRQVPSVALTGLDQPRRFVVDVVHIRATSLVRSEEHTSELQSRGHLVCRLLLEKKNQPTDKLLTFVL